MHMGKNVLNKGKLVRESKSTTGQSPVNSPAQFRKHRGTWLPSSIWNRGTGLYL